MNKAYLPVNILEPNILACTHVRSYLCIFKIKSAYLLRICEQNVLTCPYISTNSAILFGLTTASAKSKRKYPHTDLRTKQNQ